MPTYTIESGDLKVKITTAFEAEAKTLCVIAIERMPKKGKKLGRLVQVTGGQYKNDNMWVSTESVLKDMGGMKNESI